MQLFTNKLRRQVGGIDMMKRVNELEVKEND